MHYLINNYVEKGDMLPNDAPWSGLEDYQKGVDHFYLVKMGNKKLWRALRYQNEQSMLSHIIAYILFKHMWDIVYITVY